ncbi:L-asparaginase 1 [Magnetospirillum sp. SS-4]|nr:L-asparaginase 1 [Magnetospirillum sp. SS-4]
MAPCDPGDPASPLVPAGRDHLLRFAPNPPAGIAWDVAELTDGNGDPVGPLDSSDIGPRHWCLMARAIAQAYDSHDGFVILHGTDTMAYTGSALSFLLDNLAKPVVLTGSQRPISAKDGDAAANFGNALAIAGHRATGLPLVPEVVICFGDVLLRANRATKVSTTAARGFDSPNYPRLGRLGGRIDIDRSLVLSPPERAFSAHAILSGTVAVVSLYPGVTGADLGRMLDLDGVDGYVLRSFGSGNAPTDRGVIAAIAGATAAGKVIVNITQCLEGGVEMGLYQAGHGLLEAGVVDGGRLTVEAALAKLTWLLATGSAESARSRMPIPLRGEM